jgi:uncharacterized protein (TIGR00255 family)
MSLKGMTGFSRRDGALGAWSWTVETRSVNGRSLEVRFRAPPGFENLERAAREAAQARFQRGQLGVTLQLRKSQAAGAARIQFDVLERYMEAMAPLIASGRAAAPTADGLLSLRGVFETTDADEDPEARASLEAAISQDIATALDGLAEARNEEGRALADLISGFVIRMRDLAAEAEAAVQAQPQLIQERFARRLAELVGEAAAADRILQEAAVQAVRADVREELDRLGAHLRSADELLKGGQPVGRRLDFLAQEFMREANTLTAKSASSELTGVGLELKAVIDRFREQVQNVE